MPIDADNNPYDGGLGADPASTKAGAEGAVVASKEALDLSLDDAGNGATDKSADGLDLDGPTNKADLDLSLDDAGQGAKVDPSLQDDDDPTLTSAGKSGLGSALDDLDDDADVAVKDLDIGADGIHDTDHIKGLAGLDPEHDDHDPLHGDDHDHDHGHDGHDHDDGYDHH